MPSVELDQDVLSVYKNRTQNPKGRFTQSVQEIFICQLPPFKELYLTLQRRTAKYNSKISGTDGSPSTGAPQRVVSLVFQRTNAQLGQLIGESISETESQRQKDYLSSAALESGLINCWKKNSLQGIVLG